MMDILETLKDDKEYYSGVGRDYLSNSDIGTLLNNPQQFGVAREDNKALAEGRYFHQLMIEPHKAVGTPMCDASTRTTKEYKSYCETLGLDFCMLKKECEEIENLVAIMKKNITFFDNIYRPDNKFEVPMIKEIHGKMFKGKADIVCSDMLIDLKTTSDINKFKYSARAYNYDSQAYIYQTLFGKPLVFYVVDKVTNQLGIFHPTDNFIADGEAKVKRAIEIHDKYFGPNKTDDIANHYIDLLLT